MQAHSGRKARGRGWEHTVVVVNVGRRLPRSVIADGGLAGAAEAAAPTTCHSRSARPAVPRVGVDLLLNSHAAITRAPTSPTALHADPQAMQRHRPTEATQAGG